MKRESDEIGFDEVVETKFIEGDSVRLSEGVEAPEDKNNLVLRCFFFYGICALMPWSCILNCFDYIISEVISLLI
jgi:hypothetical protein